MNERIFELAELALEETHRVMGSACLQEAFDDFYTEKFAELIVEECVKQCWSVSELEHKGYVVSECSKRMRKHFGVE